MFTDRWQLFSFFWETTNSEDKAQGTVKLKSVKNRVKAKIMMILNVDQSSIVGKFVLSLWTEGSKLVHLLLEG